MRFLTEFRRRSRSALETSPAAGERFRELRRPPLLPSLALPSGAAVRFVLHSSIVRADPIEEIRSRLGDRPEVVLAYLFGSAARGTATPTSDIDIAVLVSEALPNALRYRARLAEALVEVAGGRPVEVILLDDAPPALAGRIVREGRLLLCRDEAARVRFEVRALESEFDTAPLRRVLDRGLATAIRAGRFYD